MNITEIIKKVRENLQTQNELKIQLENDDTKRIITEEKIAYTKEKLKNAEQDEIQLKEQIIDEIKEISGSLNDNLNLFTAYTYNHLADYGINARFMGKNTNILAQSSFVSSTEVPTALSVSDFAEDLFDDYLAKGTTMFNLDNIKSLKEIQRLYKIKPEVIVNKLVAMEIEKRVAKLKKKRDVYCDNIYDNNDQLEDVENQLPKLIDFKSEFLKKIFTKKAKLEQKQQNLIASNDSLRKCIENIDNELENKSQMRADSKEYVEKELNALMDIFAWIDNFETSKNKLVKYHFDYVETLIRDVKLLEEEYAGTQTKIKETKGLMQLNKKVNNEIVENALMNSNFIEQLNNIDKTPIDKDDIQAVKFIEGKYNEYLQGCVEKLVK